MCRRFKPALGHHFRRISEKEIRFFLRLFDNIGEERENLAKYYKLIDSQMVNLLKHLMSFQIKLTPLDLKG